MQASGLCLLLLALSIPAQITYARKLEGRWKSKEHVENWGLQPSAFILKAHYRLRKRMEGFNPSPVCNNYVGLPYIHNIKASEYSICAPANPNQFDDDGVKCTRPSACPSSVHCYTAPFVRAEDARNASVSLCRSHNMVLDSCKCLTTDRAGAFGWTGCPGPHRGAVKLACSLRAAASEAGSNEKLHSLSNIHLRVWWGNATQDSLAVSKACSPSSPTLVTTPTLFVMRDRHANYAHEMEVVSMAFAFLAALEPEDVAMQGVQVVIGDPAPPAEFLETWERLSRPYPLRILAENPFPPNTCFRSAFHVYTSAAGIGYNTNPETTGCESPVITGFSHWLRKLYGEVDHASRSPMPPPSAEVVAGPAAAMAGVRGFQPIANGIVLKNAVWLSRRNVDLLRVLLNESTSEMSLRMVRNEDKVIAGLLAAVQEWNAQSCLVRRFDRAVEDEYESALRSVHSVHGGRATTPKQASNEILVNTRGTGHRRRTLFGFPQQLQEQHPKMLNVFGASKEVTLPLRHILYDADRVVGGHGGGEGSVELADQDKSEDVDDGDGDFDEDSEAPAGGGGRPHPYLIGKNMLALNKLWLLDNTTGSDCRRTNVLFRFVEGDFSDMQLQTVLRAGVLMGVHSAGLALGFFMQPGHSAVLQLLGESFIEEQVAANNVFRNMATSASNYYEDVMIGGLDVDVDALKAALKRAMDFVSEQVMSAQLRRAGQLRLVLVDQSHFPLLIPSEAQCPSNTTWVSAR